MTTQQIVLDIQRFNGAKLSPTHGGEFYFKFGWKKCRLRLSIVPRFRIGKKVGCVMSDVDKEKKSSDSPEQKEEPGLMESYGSFPVWSLKLIDAITPEFLISKEPVEKKKLPQ